MIDRCTVEAQGVEAMQRCGKRLVDCLQQQKAVILLSGELGAGKTTFIQGIAEGLGILTPVVSPSYALEQRYGDVLSHLDLYRLTPAEAADFMATLEDAPGVRCIEWAEKAGEIPCDIKIAIEESERGARSIHCTFTDCPIPTDDIMRAWIDDVMLPEHIRAHMRCVATVAGIIADHLIARGRIVRKEALHAASMLHDLLRFVDFASLDGDAMFTPSAAQTERWLALKEAYGMPHEHAANLFLAERGYSGIGSTIRTHRGVRMENDPTTLPRTVEQIILAYSDKRVRFDEIVSLDERFDDFTRRYGNGRESDHAKEWRMYMKTLERWLFPDGTIPVLTATPASPAP